MAISWDWCVSYSKNTEEIFANDIQHLYDSTQRVTSLKQTNQDMVSHMAKVRDALEVVKDS